MTILGTVASSYRSAVANSYESIATISVGSGGASSVEFTSIPSTYSHLQLRYIAANQATGFNAFLIRYNADSAGNYAWHTLYGDSTSLTIENSANDTNIRLIAIPGTVYTNAFNVGVMDIVDYANTNKYKTLRGLYGVDTNAAGYTMFNSGLWQSTSAITSIKIVSIDNTKNINQYSRFALYGIKGA